jgi:hypothetical protein
MATQYIDVARRYASAEGVTLTEVELSALAADIADLAQTENVGPWEAGGIFVDNVGEGNLASYLACHMATLAREAKRNQQR